MKQKLAKTVRRLSGEVIFTAQKKRHITGEKV